MKCELKNVKVNERLSEETTCFSATLYCDGVRTAEVGNHGTGGPNEFVRVFDAARLAAFRAFVLTLPPDPPSRPGEEPLPMCEDLYVAILLEEYEKGRGLKRLERDCKTKLCFAVPGEDDPAAGVYHYLTVPDGPAGRAHVRRKYGDGAEILNDRFARRAAATAAATAAEGVRS